MRRQRPDSNAAPANLYPSHLLDERVEFLRRQIVASLLQPLGDARAHRLEAGVLFPLEAVVVSQVVFRNSARRGR